MVFKNINLLVCTKFCLLYNYLPFFSISNTYFVLNCSPFVTLQLMNYKAAARSRNYSRARKYSSLNNKLAKNLDEEKPEFYSLQFRGQFIKNQLSFHVNNYNLHKQTWLIESDY